MKDIVTAKTAQALKDAGFKQPPYGMCQIWYDPNGMKWIRMMPSYWTNPENGFTVDNANFKLAAFAPTATDILRELGQDYHIGILNHVFVAGLHQFGQSDLQFNENPAEAAALAWLEKHAK